MSNSLDYNLTRLSVARNNIASAIVAKGGTVNSGDGFEDFPADITSINTEPIPKYLKLSVGSCKPTCSKVVGVSYWESKTWSGLTNFYGYNVWSDGTNIYYSAGTTQKVLNINNSTWSNKTWSGLTNFSSSSIWTDGNSIYCSVNYYTHYVLNKSTSTWSKINISSITNNFSVGNIWSDGTDVYYDAGYDGHYIFNKSTLRWDVYSGANNYIYGEYIWSDGTNIFCNCNNYSYTYEFNKTNKSWGYTSFSGPLYNFYGYDVWSDGSQIYCNGYVYDKENTHSWKAGGIALPSMSAEDIWTDGTNVYGSYNNQHYILKTSITEYNTSVDTPSARIPIS